MDSAIKSKVLLFLIALAIPTIVFIIMAYMMSILLKGNTTLPLYVCITTVTFLLIASASQINNGIGNSLGIATVFIICIALFVIPSIEGFVEGYNGTAKYVIAEKEGLRIMFICGWASCVFMWTYNLFNKQENVTNTDKTNNETDDNNDLIGGWYGVDSQLSCWLPVLAFEKDSSATYSDGEIVKEYSYHVCCSTCIILTAKDGEKIFVKRVWVQEKPHLFYNGHTFTRDGKHSE